MEQGNNAPGTGGFVISFFCSILAWSDIQPALASIASLVAIASGVYSIVKTKKEKK